MRPGHIRVFDGLRITTEHMNHLQGSFQSALQEIRQVLGLGRVHYGLEVLSDGKGGIVVQPGLAFDSNQNRLVLDEPRSLPVEFPEGQSFLYVCLKYDQMEDGKVEDHPTMIWDTCVLSLRPQLPDTKEGLVCVARVEMLSGEDRLVKIIDLRTHDEKRTGPGKGGESNESKNEPGPTAGIPIATSSADLAVGGGGLRAATARIDALPFSCKQGVWKFGPSNVKDLQDVILEGLRGRLRGAGRGSTEDIVVSIGESDASVGPEVLSVSCISVLSLTLNIIGSLGRPSFSAVTTSALKDQDWLVQATSQGEATVQADQVSQFGLSQIQYNQVSAGGVGSMGRAEFAEKALCVLPLGILENLNIAESGKWILDVLRRIQLQIEILRKEDRSLKFGCNLIWQGGVTESLVIMLENQPIGFKWEGSVGWKSVGPYKR